MQNDDLMFAPEEVPSGKTFTQRNWKVAIIDDAMEVHSVTKMVLSDVRFRDRKVEFFSAYSAAEGKELLKNTPDIAVVFLDVVMENDHAGLDLVDYIRSDLQNRNIRIILRTGQPGDSPESEIILKYDINDYKNKSELSSEKLFTTLISGLRSYQDLVTIETSRVGLRNILLGTSKLFRRKSTDQYLSGVLMQLNAIFQLGDDAILYVRNINAPVPYEKVMAASGKFQSIVGINSESEGFPQDVRASITRTLSDKSSSYARDQFSIYFYSGLEHEIMIYIELGRELNTLDVEMIDIFCANISLGLEGVHVLEVLEDKVTQRTQELVAGKVALEHANSQLHKLSTTDTLTNIFNRRAIYDQADSLFNVTNSDQVFSVFLLDIDHFKKINDNFGHAAGDIALVRFSETVKNMLPPSFKIGRMGGEEFLVIGTCDKVSELSHLAGQILEEVAAICVDWDGAEIKFTTSIGITVKTDNDLNVQALIDRSDAAMYEAKEQGRNRYVIKA